LRDALFIKENLSEIAKAIAKDAETKLQAKIDTELGNTQLPNTATASDGAGVNPQELQGYSKFLQDQKGNRVTKL